jgi:hypothetical protein
MRWKLMDITQEPRNGHHVTNMGRGAGRQAGRQAHSDVMSMLCVYFNVLGVV